jgi:hypothetical protein
MVDHVAESAANVIGMSTITEGINDGWTALNWIILPSPSSSLANPCWF